MQDSQLGMQQKLFGNTSIHPNAMPSLTYRVESRAVVSMIFFVH